MESESLEEIDRRKAKVIELRVYLGCSAEETAGVLNLSKATVDRDMKLACAFLCRELRRLQFGGSVFDHGENLGSEPPDQLLRENRSDPLDQAAAEIPLDPLSGGRRHRLHDGRLELQSVFLVPDPPALRAQPFPGSHRRQRSSDRCFIPLPACFHSQDTEAAFVVGEGYPLEPPGDFFGCRSALLDCGINRGFIFPWTV